MIQIPIFLSLVAGGFASAVWREYRQARTSQGQFALPQAVNKKKLKIKLFSKAPGKPFDDIAELTHYQRVSWYSLAFSTSGAWFYPPAMLVSVPLLSYNAYYFIKTVRHSSALEQKSAMTVFETIGIAGTLFSGRVVTASLLMLCSFGVRKLQLQGGNMANIDLVATFNPKNAKVWVLRGGAEIEIVAEALQEHDTVVLHAGDTVITEGIVVNGNGIISQYCLQKTMKSIPKQAGDQVFPFTYLASGCLYIQPRL